MTTRSSVRKAVIPAAGLGTRFLPATKAVPKEMLPIVDVPTIQLVIDEAVHAGVTDVIVVNGRGKHAIEDHLITRTSSSTRCASAATPGSPTR